MAKDENKKRKSSRSFDLSKKNGNHSFDLEKKSARSFDLQKEVDSVQTPAVAPSTPVAGTNSGKQPVDTNTGKNGGKKWLIIAAIIIAIIALAVWALSRGKGQSSENTDEPQTMVTSDSTGTEADTQSESTTVAPQENGTQEEQTEADKFSSEDGQNATDSDSEPSSKPERVAAPIQPSTPTAEVSGSVKEIANDVVSGKYGNWPEREKALGDRYKEVQREVNRMYRDGEI